MRACQAAEQLAIVNFGCVEVTSACVIFIALLGHDPNRLRLHLQVANQIAAAAHILSNHSSSAVDPVSTSKICECRILTVELTTACGSLNELLNVAGTIFGDYLPNR